MTEEERDEEERSQAVMLALGRIFRLMARPAQTGDVADYEAARAVVMTVLDPPPFVSHAPNYARDRKAIVAGGDAT